MLLVQCVWPKSPVRVQDIGHELKALPRFRYAAYDVPRKPPFRFTLSYTVLGPPLRILLPLCLVHLVKNVSPQKRFRVLDRGHFPRHHERHETHEHAPEREPLAHGTVVAPRHVCDIVLVVAERRGRSHEEHADDAPTVRELVVRGAVQDLCWDSAKRPPGDVERDSAPAIWVEVKQRRHVARETVDVERGWRRRGGVSPAGERGADVDVLGRDDTRDPGGLRPQSCHGGKGQRSCWTRFRRWHKPAYDPPLRRACFLGWSPSRSCNFTGDCVLGTLSI